jgi:uncharacterized peroxidase-related enzyme
MSRIAHVAKETAPDALKALYEEIEKKKGMMLLNIFRAMANSPKALSAFLAMQDASARSSLSPQVRELLSLYIAEYNGCHYCLGAHYGIAKNMLHLEEGDITAARKGDARDDHLKAILRFTKAILDNHGKVDQEVIDALRKQGSSDQEICDIILLISLNTFSNYFNNLVETDLDFPEAPKL